MKKIITMKDVAGLMFHLRTTTSPLMCDHNTFKITKKWLKKNGLGEDVLEIFKEDGVKCDCELLKNKGVYTRFFGKEEFLMFYCKQALETIEQDYKKHKNKIVYYSKY